MPTTHFQAQVQKTLAKGVPGDKATLNAHVYTDQNYIAGAGVTVGNFVWADPANPLPANYNGSGVLKALATGTGQPMGIVERILSYVNTNMTDGGTLAVAERSALNIVKRGDLYAVSATAATKGQKVFAVLANGTLKTGAAGATVAGAIETSWTVTEGGAASELITISSWSV